MTRLWLVVAAAILITAAVTWFLCRIPAGPETPIEPGTATEPASRTPETPAAPKPVKTAEYIQRTPVEATATRSAADEAKWAEAKTVMGTIATAIRAYFVEVGPQGRPPATIEAVGLMPTDLVGVYFGPADYSLSVTSMDPLTFTVTCTPGSKPNAPTYPARLTLDSAGNWTSE